MVARVLIFAGDPEPTIQRVKAVERAVGFKPTGNFAREDPTIRAYFRCYYTGKVDLPESFDALKLREGTANGCTLNEKKYDVFFYPIEAVATGHTPVTQSLASASTARIATVVPHEDFHAQIPKLPDELGEAASTLVGFLTGAAATGAAPQDAELFLRKSEIVNRYFEQLAAVYRRPQSRSVALEEKRRIFDALTQECQAIQPEPRSFNKCISAANNAGLAFDHTYTKFYPLLYQVYIDCARDLPCLTRRILDAPAKGRQRELVRYFTPLQTPAERSRN
jgi:hypothetical protein